MSAMNDKLVRMKARTMSTLMSQGKSAAAATRQWNDEIEAKALAAIDAEELNDSYLESALNTFVQKALK